eukprot:scaffold6910_cov136-Isochrysis_galbana.AAC.7
MTEMRCSSRIRSPLLSSFVRARSAMDTYRTVCTLCSRFNVSPTPRRSMRVRTASRSIGLASKATHVREGCTNCAAAATAEHAARSGPAWTPSCSAD